MLYMPKLQSQNTRKGRLPRAATNSQRNLNFTKAHSAERDDATKRHKNSPLSSLSLKSLSLTSINRDQSFADWYYDSCTEQEHLYSIYRNYFISETGSLSTRSGEL